MKTETDRKLILSSVRALKGHVSPPLRAVSVEMVNDVIQWKCEYDSNATEDDFELGSMAAGEVAADFPWEFSSLKLSVPMNFQIKSILLKILFIIVTNTIITNENQFEKKS